MGEQHFVLTHPDGREVRCVGLACFLRVASLIPDVVRLLTSVVYQQDTPIP